MNKNTRKTEKMVFFFLQVYHAHLEIASHSTKGTIKDEISEQICGKREKKKWMNGKEEGIE